MSAIGFVIFTVAVIVPVLLIWHWTDRQADRAAWRELIAHSRSTPTQFDSTILEGLPQPAQRYFRFTIAEGAPLATAVELDLHGELCLGTRERHTCRTMRARQLLAPPFGLVWSMRAGLIAGSDGITPQTSWTRFWLSGFFPIVRVSGNPDHHRSAFGRIVSEAAFWAPASLLPSSFVRWKAMGEHTARAVVTYGKFQQAVDITIEDDGRPVQVVIARWSNENPDKRFREQPFGGELSAFKNFGGYTLPTRVTGGNHFGTPDYFPFYRATVSDIRFPTLGAEP